MEIKKISIIEPVGGHGGNDLYDVNLIAAINAKKDFKAILYTCNETKLLNTNLKIYYKNIFIKNKILGALNYFLGTLISLYNSKKENVEIIHLHFFGFNILEYFNLYLSKRLFGFNVVATIHDVESFADYNSNENDDKNKVIRFIKLLDGIIFHTEYAKMEFKKKTDQKYLINKVLKTIFACDLDYNLLEKEKTDPSKAKDIIGLPKNKYIILFFGQIKKVKGLEILINALKILVEKKIKNVLLVIAGKVWKDDFSYYQNLIRKYSLQPYVDLRIKFISNDELPFYFYSADVIALPYKKIYNSGVLIRAMSFGKPIIASDFGPFKEFISNGENGLLFQAGNAEELAKNIRKILSDDNLKTKLSNNVTKIVREKFALKELGEQYREFYLEVLKKRESYDN